MTASLSVNGIGLTGACARILLRGLVNREIDLDTLDPRIPPTMEKRGFATIEATCLRISPRGMEIAKALQAKGWEPEPLKRGPKKAKTAAHEDPTPQDARSTSDRPTRGASKRTARKAAGQSRPSNRSTASPRPSGTPRRKDSPPPTGVVDFAALRAQIVAHYEADLAACDRMRDIASRVREA